MPQSLRFKHRISLMVGIASLALLTVSGVALLLARHGIHEVSAIETRYVPLLELKRDLETTFVLVTRTLENAASAAEEGELRSADALRDRFLVALEAGEKTISENGADPRMLRREFLAYYGLAREVSQRLIDGSAGDDLLERAQGMHQAQERFASLLETASTPDRTRLAAAFDSARDAYSATVTVDVVVAASAFLVMLVMSWWIVRHVARSLQKVTEGVNRLAHGDFSQEIQVTGRDELGELAREANQTAVRLRDYRQLVEREDWVKTGSGGLAGEIAGELDLAALGGRAVTYLARYVGAVTAAAYASDESGLLTLLEGYGHGGAAQASFAPGEGLIGQAVRDCEVRLVSDLPDSFAPIKSALGHAVPRHLLIVPFSHQGRCMGVMELAFFDMPGAQVLELMRRTRDALGIAYRVAESRMRVTELVEKMQKQAEELRTAYGTLKAQNLALQDSEQRLHRQQEEVQAANDELLQTHVQLEEKASELTRASQYKSEFLASMSHELRTPLNSIMLLSRILATRDTDVPHARQVEFAEVIFKSGDELLGLINDVLDLAKVEAGKQELVYSAVAVQDVATYVQQMFEPLAAQKGLAFRVEQAGGLGRYIQTDLMRLEQILKNLLSNAIKFTDEGQVSVRIYAPQAEERETAGAGPGDDQEMIAIAVEDTGPGIAPEKQEIIFEAFAQAHGGHGRQHGGTGLGLAIARQLAMRMGGHLRVDSEPGVGSTFTLYVPTAEPRRRRRTTAAPPFLRANPRAAPHDTERAGLAEERSGEGDKPAPALSLVPPDALLAGKRLLIVDDDMRHVYSLTNLLQAQRLDIIAASDGLEALDQLERISSIDIILMDVVMPRMDGHEAIRRIRQHPRFHSTPIIALTARTAPGEHEKCMEAGASEFLAKPVDLDRLLAALNKWLTHPANGASPHARLLAAAEPSPGPES